LIDAAEKTLAELCQHPLIGSPKRFDNPSPSNVRMWRWRDFEKYLIFYHPTEHGIEVLHLLHAA
jgi:plasmid stabilization system protein ParE